MEAITAFLWGPLCPLLVHGIFTAKSWRYTLMVIISVGQIYGDVLYYGTCYLEGFVHSRPEALYFWGYFVALNALWIVIPGAVLLYATSKLSSAVAGGDSAKVGASVPCDPPARMPAAFKIRWVVVLPAAQHSHTSP